MNYENKQEGYYNNVRHDLIRFFNKSITNLKVLEVGAAYGETLFFLKKSGIASEVVGIELFQDSTNIDKYKELDQFLFGDIQTLDVSNFDNYFDVILLADVLEHLIEPLPVLEKVKNLLKKDGEIIISIPNIRHYSSFIKIFIKGNFQYEDSGIFDYTHTRFYCKKDIIKLVQKAGFTIEISEGSIKNYQGKSAAKIFNFLTFGVFEEFLSVQYFFKIKKAN
jgi:2-polyprenyl-3-methyl-5-hydroxy-6-metoxy-1,4-benzoquinol methylase